ncbi:MAG: hypothetical protein M0010_20355 [Actinomycetota bacterium]|nr:hypothetical protein [Actinomycetota bacterium]
MASSTEDVSGGTEAGAVTPGNPVTPVHVPTGSETVLPRNAPAEDAGGELAALLVEAALVEAALVEAALVEAALVEAAPCGDVVAGTDPVTGGAVVAEAGAVEVVDEVFAPSLEPAGDQLTAEEPLGARKR